MTPAPPEEWSFELLPPERQQLLAAQHSFEQLAREIASNANLISAWIEPYRTPPRDAPPMAQAIFRLEVGRAELDRFHNGRDGLRARYWRSPEEGDRATRLLIDLLEPTLLQRPLEAPRKKPWAMSEADVLASLRHASAKVWITERLNGGSLIEVDNSCRLCVRRWEENESRRPEMRSWRWTPARGTLEIKGALITKDHVGHIPEAKLDRAAQIHQFGWT